MFDFHSYFNKIEGFGDLIAFANPVGESTYKKLIEDSDIYLEMLQKNKILPGLKVAVVGDFTAKTIALIFALFNNANIVIPISAQSNVELKSILDISGCDWFLDFRSNNEILIESLSISNFHAEILYERIRENSSPGLVLFSSGTSGKPKGIVHDVNKVIKKFEKVGKQYTSIPLLMFDHFGGYNTILGLLSSGSRIVNLRDRTVDSVAKAIEDFEVTLLPTTPSFLALFLASRVDSKYNLESLEKISYGTEVMPSSLLDRLHKRFPTVKFQQTYGLSELGVLSSKSKSDDSTWLQLGGSGYELRIVDGYLWIKSEFSMLGYIAEDGHTFAEEWFNTQDRVEVDGDFIRILGRDSDLINVGGQKVFPQEIEEVLLRLDEVVSVRISSAPHNLLGQIVKAEISLANSSLLSKGDIRAFCKQHLTSFKVPQMIEFVDDIPLTHRMKKGKKIT
jgi:acyl-CoA synthetase (AMP-forming)/AMP-acid ligase II